MIVTMGLSETCRAPHRRGPSLMHDVEDSAVSARTDSTAFVARAVRELEERAGRADWRTVVEDRLDREPPAGLGNVVIGILEQALENIAQHAGAAVVRLGFSSLNDELRVVVVDDGVGFEFAEEAGGFGLTAMREAAEAVGGELVIESRSGRGTRVNIVVPFASP